MKTVSRIVNGVVLSCLCRAEGCPAVFGRLAWHIIAFGCRSVLRKPHRLSLCIALVADDGRTLTYGPHTEAPLEEELAASPPPPQQRPSLDSCLSAAWAPQQAQRAASTRLREQAQQAEKVRTLYYKIKLINFKNSILLLLKKQKNSAL